MKMRLSAVIPALVLSVVLTSGAGAHRVCRHDGDWTLKDKSIELEDGRLVIEHEEEGWTVEITDDYELYVDGRRVKTDREQKKLLKRYYRDFEKIEDMAEDLAREGAAVGLEGAKLGVSAVACIAKLLLEDYDSDDMEDEMEVKTEDLEKMAEKLEKKADKLEDIADDLEKTHRKLRRSIPELGDLEDF
jgi:vacuolar-type H+-ATPase catalytic subunit A/Vma1